MLIARLVLWKGRRERQPDNSEENFERVQFEVSPAACFLQLRRNDSFHPAQESKQSREFAFTAHSCLFIFVLALTSELLHAAIGREPLSPEVIMAGRIWPWRKKSSYDKIAAVPTSIGSSPAFSCERQNNPKILKEHLQISEEPKLLVKQCEQCKYLTEKLSAALNDISAKEYTIQQHKKVAEDAVSGWERSQEEAASLRKQLDESATQKLEIANRASHLDEALKELKRELYKLREEQEHKIQNVILCNNNTWNTVRSEFEARLSNASHRLLREQGEKNDVLKSFQDATKALSELHHSNSVAEAEAKMLQAKVEAVVRENSGLKFELQGINKLLDHCNEERVTSLKEIDVANRRHLECAKKLEKLESECQKLRVSLRRKSALSSQPSFWRLELESPRKDIGEGKKRYSIANAGSPRAEPPEISSSPRPTTLDFSFSDRLSAMEDEGQMLKEALTQRNGELQAARLMCARTASKLSQVEEHLDVVQVLQRTNAKTTLINHKISPSLASLPDTTCNVDETYSAEAWAAALVTELAQFKKERIAANSDSFSDVSHFDLMEDFEDMERLASKIPSSKTSAHENFVQAREKINVFQQPDDVVASKIGLLNTGISVEDKGTAMEDTPKAKQKVMELKTNLSIAEENLSTVRSKIVSGEDFALHLQQQLQAVQSRENMDKFFVKTKTTVEVPDKSTSKVTAEYSFPSTSNAVDQLAAIIGAFPPDNSPIRSNWSFLEAPCKAEDMEEETKDMLVPCVFPSKITGSDSHIKDLNSQAAFDHFIKQECLDKCLSQLQKYEKGMESNMDMIDEKIKQMRGHVSSAERLVQLSPWQQSKPLTENQQAIMSLWKIEDDFGSKNTEGIKSSQLNERLVNFPLDHEDKHKEHHDNIQEWHSFSNLKAQQTSKEMSQDYVPKPELAEGIKATEAEFNQMKETMRSFALDQQKNDGDC